MKTAVLGFILYGLLSGCAKKGTLLYSKTDQASGYRYEVYAYSTGSIMPGSSYGGAGEVIAYDRAANVVFRKKIQSTFSEIGISDTNIYIPGDGTYEFKKKK